MISLLNFVWWCMVPNLPEQKLKLGLKKGRKWIQIRKKIVSLPCIERKAKLVVSWHKHFPNSRKE